MSPLASLSRENLSIRLCMAFDKNNSIYGVYLRHPGAGRDPVRAPKNWIPACAGMTEYLRGVPTLKAGDLGGWIAFFAVDNFRRFRLETACG
jgi:hypothetical protein